MKALRFGVLALMVLGTSAALCAQRHARSSGGRSSGGQRSGSGYSRPMSYGSNYGYGATPNFVSPYLFAPGSQPVYGGSGSHVILVSRSEEDDPVYIPSYMRPSEGPSLAEQAAALKAARKPAVLTWSNQGTVGTPVP